MQMSPLAGATIAIVFILAFPRVVCFLYYGWNRWLKHREIMADKRTAEGRAEEEEEYE